MLSKYIKASHANFGWLSIWTYIPALGRDKGRALYPFVYPFVFVDIIPFEC